jgi:hypothetical protein
MTRAPPHPPRPKTPQPPPPKPTSPHRTLVPQQIRHPSSCKSPSAHAPKRSHQGRTLKNVSNSGSDSTVASKNGPDASLTTAISTTESTNDRSLSGAPLLSPAENLQSRVSRKRSCLHESAEVCPQLSSDEGESGSGGDQGEDASVSGYELPSNKSVGSFSSSVMALHNSSRIMTGLESDNSPSRRHAHHESRDVEKASPDDKLRKSTSTDESKPSLAISPLLEDAVAAPQDAPPKVAPTKTLSKSRMEFELMREKLEQAKQRKLELQDKLEQEKQAKSVDPPNHSLTTAVPRARARLVGASTNREKALQVKDSQTLPPISALIEDLVITNISQTGTEEMVRIPAGLIDDMGMSDVVAEHNNDHIEAQVQESEVLAARKNKLQQDLGALKLRLERKQKAAMGRKRSQVDGDLPVGDINPKKKVKSVASKEELERRKVEAQGFVDVSYWKHFVSKQKHLLVEVTNQVKDNAKARAKCDKEFAKISLAIVENASQVEVLEMRQGIVSDMLMDSVTKLLDTRNRLYTQSGFDSATADVEVATIEESPEVTAAASVAVVEHSDLASVIGAVRDATETRDDSSDSSGNQFADPV